MFKLNRQYLLVEQTVHISFELYVCVVETWRQIVHDPHCEKLQRGRVNDETDSEHGSHDFTAQESSLLYVIADHLHHLEILDPKARTLLAFGLMHRQQGIKPSASVTLKILVADEALGGSGHFQRAVVADRSTATRHRKAGVLVANQ